jgi:hypothetical protein
VEHIHEYEIPKANLSTEGEPNAEARISKEKLLALSHWALIWHFCPVR